MKKSNFIILILSVFCFQPGLTQDTMTFDSAYTIYKNKEYSKALKAFREIYEQQDSSTFFRAQYMMAYCHYRLKEYEAVAPLLDSVFTYAPEDPEFHWVKGNAHWLMARTYDVTHQKEAALKEFKKATKYLNSSLLYSTIALVEHEMDNLESALNNASLAIKMDQNNSFAFNNRALILKDLGQLEKAMVDVNQSIEINSKNPYAFKHRAMIYLAMNELERACRDLHKADDLGYSSFQNEIDSMHVRELLDEHCQNQINTPSEYFEGELTFDAFYESTSPHMSIDLLESLYGYKMIAKVKEDKYLLIRKSPDEYGDSKTIFKLRENMGYIMYDYTDTIFTFPLDKTTADLINFGKHTKKPKVVLGDTCQSISISYNPNDEYVNQITGTYYYNPKYKLNPEFYKKHLSGFWNLYANEAKSVSVRSEIIYYPLYKSLHELVNVEEKEIDDEEFWIDFNQPMKMMEDW